MHPPTPGIHVRSSLLHLSAGMPELLHRKLSRAAYGMCASVPCCARKLGKQETCGHQAPPVRGMPDPARSGCPGYHRHHLWDGRVKHTTNGSEDLAPSRTLTGAPLLALLPLLPMLLPALLTLPPPPPPLLPPPLLPLPLSA